MGLRNAKAYSKKYARPYTRKSRIKSKAYIKTIPPQKVVKFFMGNINAYKSGSYPFVLRLISKENVMARDNAIEAARQVVHKELEILLPNSYFFTIKKYPHHILRENKMYSGGSKGERVNQGMQMAFGAAMGRAAFIAPGDEIFVVAFAEKKSIQPARAIIEKIKPKLPCATKIVLEIIKSQ